LQEILGLNSANPRQFIILTAGNWVSATEFLQKIYEMDGGELQDDFPFITYTRPKELLV